MYNTYMKSWDIGSLNRGKSLSESTKGKISSRIKELIKEGKFKVPNTGEQLSVEHRRKISLSRKGSTPWNKNKIGVMPTPWNKGKAWSNEVREKISYAKKGTPAWNKGIKRTEEEKRKMAEGARLMWLRRKGKISNT